MIDLLIYVIAGAVVGFVSGLFGIGGGVVVVPVLLPVFQAQGLSMDVAMHMAIGSSLATIVLTGLSSARAHWRLGNVVLDALPWLVAGLMAGALLGAQIAAALPGDVLRIIFALFLLTLAVRMALALEPAPGRIMPRRSIVAVAGLAIGILSSLVGIGGGSLVVPFLASVGMAMRNAVGTSAAAGVTIAVAGTVGFIVAGTGDDALPPLSTGYIYWPAVGGIAFASVLLAPLGARVATRLPAVWLRRGFAVFLVIVGLRLLLMG